MILRTLASAISAAVLIAAPAVAEDAHHPRVEVQTPPTSVQDAKPEPSGCGMGMMGAPRGAPNGMSVMGGEMHVIAPLFGMDAMGPVEHVEGRLAFLRAELAKTEGQQAAWSAFTDSVRKSAKEATGSPGMMKLMPSGSAPERLQTM